MLLPKSETCYKTVLSVNFLKLSQDIRPSFQGHGCSGELIINKWVKEYFVKKLHHKIKFAKSKEASCL